MKEYLLQKKYYVAAILMALGVYTWAGYTGRKLIGDDRETEESGSSGRSGSGGHYYHK